MSLASGSGGAPFRVGAAVSRSFSVFFAAILLVAPGIIVFRMLFVAPR